MYDAAAMQRALKPPAVEVLRTSWWERALVFLRLLPETKTYTGRLLSQAEFAPFFERFYRAWTGEVDEEQAGDLFVEYMDAIGIPAHVVEDLPERAVEEMLEDFFTCQSRAIWGENPPWKRTATTASAPADGSPSGSKTNEPDPTAIEADSGSR